MAVTLRTPPKVLTSSGFRWLRTGADALRAMRTAIETARTSVRLETYIFHEGPVGEKFREALVAAAQRGVKVQVLVDAFGSTNLPAAFWDPLKKAGGEFASFNPLVLDRWSYRDHRKVLVCDDSIGFIGGFNIADEYQGDGITSGWRDLGLEVSGPLVAALATSFDGFFGRANLVHKRLQILRKAPTEITGGENWELLFSGPGRHHGAVKHRLARDLRSAKSVKFICAYFLPTWRLRKELLRVSKRGGKVQLILAGKSDVAVSRLASRRLYNSLLRVGVEIYEYQPQILHAKMFILDDVVYAGSSNLDTRSLRINHELLVRIDDAKVAAEAREMFDGDLPHCRRIDPATWSKSRNFWDKLREDWAYFMLARVDPFLARRRMKTLR